MIETVILFIRYDFYDQTIVGIVSLVSLQVEILNSAKSIIFCYYINRKDMTCHESKICFFEYVRKDKAKNNTQS